MATEGAKGESVARVAEYITGLLHLSGDSWMYPNPNMGPLWAIPKKKQPEKSSGYLWVENSPRIPFCTATITMGTPKLSLGVSPATAKNHGDLLAGLFGDLDLSCHGGQ